MPRPTQLNDLGSNAELGTMRQVAALRLQMIDDLTAERDQLRALAKDAYEAWENDRDARVGKLLRAMTDDEFRAVYRPDTVMPNAI